MYSKIQKTILVLILTVAFAAFRNSKVQADTNSFITIVNPIRLSSYTKDPVASLNAEYLAIQKRNLPATWLLTYDVISKPDLSSVFAEMNDKQELGIFLEVTPDFSRSSNIQYNQTNSWHRATSLFLSGYSQEDRKKLIDTVFLKFKEKFGYYPKSIGAWWVDSYSLSYMKEKYGIIGVLGISDQYDLDGYQVWGTFWSTPYYPNKINAALSAQNSADKLDVVAFRWAPRDPINGYLSPTKRQASLYSTQDYGSVGLSADYFKKLVGLYLLQNQFNKFGQATIGLESDYSPDFYSGFYSTWLDYVQDFQKKGVNITSMNQFSDWYRSHFPDISPTHVIDTGDLLGKPERVFWVQNSRYRIGLLYNKEGYACKVIDFRVYPEDLEEPFYKSPNKQYNLSINLPFIIDSVIDKNNTWEFNTGRLASVKQVSDNLELIFKKGKIIFSENSIVITGIKVSKIIFESKQIDVRKNAYEIKLSPRQNFYVGRQGLEFKDYSLNIPFTIEYKIEKYKIPIAIAIVVFGIWMLYIFRIKKIHKRYLLFVVILGIIFFGLFLFIQTNKKYYISQTEADALSVLSRFPQGKVLVYDKDCLKCSFVTPFKPAAAAGKKGYIARYSNQPTVADFSFVTAYDSKTAGKILKDLNIKYVYLAKYESYTEYLPYPPEDIGLKKVYENANAEMFEVLK